MSLGGEDAGVFLVVVVDVFFEGSFSGRGGEVIGESLSISGDGDFLFAVEGGIGFVEEVSVPGLISHDTIVQKEFEDDEFGEDGSSGSWGDI